MPTLPCPPSPGLEALPFSGGWCTGIKEGKENALALPGGHLLLIFLEGKGGFSIGLYFWASYCVSKVDCLKQHLSIQGDPRPLTRPVLPPSHLLSVEVLLVVMGWGWVGLLVASGR